MPFDVDGGWEIIQANGWHVRLNIAQDGTGIKGSARARHPSVAEEMNGQGEGQVTDGDPAPGDQFGFAVNWGGSHPIRSHYSGTFGFDHRLTGFNYPDGSGPQTTWFTEHVFN